MLSLVTIQEAAVYVQYHLKRRIWDQYDEPMVILVSATRIIQQLPLKLEVRENFESEPPIIPEEIKEACIEIALALAEGIDPEMEYRQLSKTTQGYSSLRQQKNTDMMEYYLALGIPCFAAWVRLAPFLDIERRILLERIS